MIFDTLEHLPLYTPDGGALRRAFAFVRGGTPRPYGGEGFRAALSEYGPAAGERPSSPLFEMHREHIDLHIILEGEEEILLLPSGDAVWGRYGAAKDIAFGHGKPVCSLLLKAGSFLLCYPHDAHALWVPAGTERVRKWMIKIER